MVINRLRLSLAIQRQENHFIFGMILLLKLNNQAMIKIVRTFNNPQLQVLSFFNCGGVKHSFTHCSMLWDLSIFQFDILAEMLARLRLQNLGQYDIFGD
jgi:hypothetical protein